MNREILLRIKQAEDKKMLAHLQKLWLGYTILATVDPDPSERMYARRLATTADELICSLQAKMVRRYIP